LDKRSGRPAFVLKLPLPEDKSQGEQ
jgi:hypothetical protein